MAREIEALARELGGGWCVEQGVMPVVVLTLDEARNVRGRIEQQHENEQVRRLNREGRCPTCGADA
jgi:hypothetical protein